MTYSQNISNKETDYFKRYIPLGFLYNNCKLEKGLAFVKYILHIQQSYYKIHPVNFLIIQILMKLACFVFIVLVEETAGNVFFYCNITNIFWVDLISYTLSLTNVTHTFILVLS